MAEPTVTQLLQAIGAGLDLLALDQAVEALKEHDPRLAEVVELRYFVGLSIPEAAAAMGSSPATVKRDWVYGRAWLYEYMME